MRSLWLTEQCITLPLFPPLPTGEHANGFCDGGFGNSAKILPEQFLRLPFLKQKRRTARAGAVDEEAYKKTAGSQ